MSELMEHGLHLIKSKQRRLAVDRLREVAYVDDHRTDILAVNNLLVHEVVHPCATSLGAAWKIVSKKNSDKAAVRICHLESFYIRMIYRDILKLLEVQTKELVGSIEHTLADVFHLEVRLGLLLIEGILCLAYLLSVICPVPRLDLRTLRKKTRLDILIHDSLHIGNLLLCLCNCRSH